MTQQQDRKVVPHGGFIAALGRSTAKAPKLYAIPESESPGHKQLLTGIRTIRTRTLTSPAHAGERVQHTIVIAVVDQRIVTNERIATTGAVPAFEPEVAIHSPNRNEQDDFRRACIDRPSLCARYGPKAPREWIWRTIQGVVVAIVVGLLGVAGTRLL